jgi:hypothetical protein
MKCILFSSLAMKRRKQISADELRFGCQHSNLKVMGGAQTILCPNAQYHFQENQLTIKK